MWYSRWLRPFFFILAVSGGLTRPSQAELITRYVSVNSSTTPQILPNFTASGVSGNALQAGSGVGAVNAAFWTWNNWDATSASSGNSLGEFFQWGFSSGAAAWNLTDLDLRYDRSPTGPVNVEIYLSVNGNPYALIHTDTSVSDSGEDNLNIDLSSFTNVTAATFRLYAFNASNQGSGTFALQNRAATNSAIEVNGLMAAVPEPGTWIFSCGITITACLKQWRSRRKRRAQVS